MEQPKDPLEEFITEFSSAFWGKAVKLALSDALGDEVTDATESKVAKAVGGVVTILNMTYVNLLSSILAHFVRVTKVDPEGEVFQGLYDALVRTPLGMLDHLVADSMENKLENDTVENAEITDFYH